MWVGGKLTHITQEKIMEYQPNMNVIETNIQLKMEKNKVPVITAFQIVKDLQ